MSNHSNPLCCNEMQVHNIIRETDDVYTLELIAQDYYPYEPGQYALVSIADSPTITRAYTLSSSPGLSPFLTLTVRRIKNGIGSNWLTQEVKVGDLIRLSDPMGEFTCSRILADNYLLVAGGCGVTPIMSMTRWLLKHRPQVNLRVIYSVHEPKDVIFKREWQALQQQYPQLELFINASVNATEGFIAGRISQAMLARLIPDIADYSVLTCGPQDYMDQLKSIVTALGVAENRFYSEQFHSSAENCLLDTDKQAVLSISAPLAQNFKVPVGMSLLTALESNGVPIIAGCRTGVCGSCKTLVLSGEYESDNYGPLTEEEIKQGYVLACSCRLKGNLKVNMLP
ncbi:NADH oxidoreductase Hcr [Mesocricetibacter intestinalis]|uniref:NADH oxidoreductase Hcr n=1 Tax=Mesocricetibacter intestinalis TaxID=1521930 RepID=A0A4R6V803_9PAST|nr:NADH oxidoreductase [Mesocricetibacter intestinalis]TDQ57615.1 NADH oxidoreductase Hcr [Mesocricetibacter intestinalis]